MKRLLHLPTLLRGASCWPLDPKPVIEARCATWTVKPDYLQATLAGSGQPATTPSGTAALPARAAPAVELSIVATDPEPSRNSIASTIGITPQAPGQWVLDVLVCSYVDGTDQPTGILDIQNQIFPAAGAKGAGA